MDDYQDLTVSVTGNTQSRVNMISEGTTYDAININSTGGIYAYSDGPINIQSNNSANGIKIGTDISNIPIYIGTPSNTTTVYGNLDVKGVTTTVESVTVTIKDNILIVNNAPSGTADGGLAIKRYQSANDSSYGDVIADIPDHSGIVQSSNNTITTVHLSLDASNVDNYYAGWWIKITGGTGENQVRRIRSYSGSTRIAIIYSTVDQNGILDNPIPQEGLDFSTIPDVTSTYSLYPCEFVMLIWDESRDEFAFVCSNQNPSDNTSIVHYSDLHANDIIANNVTLNTINGSDADITTYVTLNNNSTAPVTISGFPKKYGVYQVFVKPSSESDTTRTHAIFTICRVNVSNIPGTVIRIISVKGVYNDQLDIQWPNDSLPQLLYRPYPNGISGSTTFKLKIVSL
jgi:hypothetical protein